MLIEHRRKTVGTGHQGDNLETFKSGKENHLTSSIGYLLGCSIKFPWPSDLGHRMFLFWRRGLRQRLRGRASKETGPVLDNWHELNP